MRNNNALSILSFYVGGGEKKILVVGFVENSKALKAGKHSLTG